MKMESLLYTSSSGRQCLYVELPITDYREALELQRSIVAARNNHTLDCDVILILEHSAVFTLGRRGGLDNLTVSETFLEKKGIPVVHVERGGDITYHGPGQLIGYPIIDLRTLRLSVTDYVSGLEEIMLRTAADFGVAAERNPKNRGIWVGNSKLGSIGISIRHGVAFHGFAFNVNIFLEPFCWINPCGLKEVGITSLSKALSRTISMRQVRRRIRHHLSAVFGFDLVPIKVADLQDAAKKLVLQAAMK